MKKLFCVLFAAVMVFSVNASAFTFNEDDNVIEAKDLNNKAAVYFEDQTVYSGQDCTVDILIKNNPAIKGAVITVDGGEGFTVKSVASSDDFTAVYSSGKITLTSQNEVTDDTVLCKLTFSVSKRDVYTVLLSAEAKDIEDNDVKILSSNCKVDSSSCVLGDANGDGTFDAKDLTRLKKYFAKITDEIDLGGADINGDGNVDAKDLTRMKKTLAQGK